jgi:N-acetylmuramoyl-L-alanine amidase
VDVHFKKSIGSLKRIGAGNQLLTMKTRVRAFRFNLVLPVALPVAICAFMNMRNWLMRTWLLAAVIFAASAQAAYINGRSYVALSDWARKYGFHLVHDGKRNSVLYTKGTARAEFEKDSHTADINGVNVLLSFPVATDKGEFFIAGMDLEKTVDPLLFPWRADDNKIRTIVIDPGHGGKDPGNRAGAHYEKTYTLLLANELSRQLTAAGFRVILTRTRDIYVDLESRPAVANRHDADLFISLHFNATGSGKGAVQGAETYCITPVGASSSNAQGRGANYGRTTANASETESLLFAYEVQKALTKNLGAADRGVRRARFAVLRDAKMPAILVESGYMTHPVEGKKIFTEAYRKQIAAAITKGVLDFQRLTKPAK